MGRPLGPTARGRDHATPGVRRVAVARLRARVGPADHPVVLGAMACLGGAFGRTMSPVSAVVVYGSGLVGAPPFTVIRHLLPALLAGGVVALGVALR